MYLIGGGGHAKVICETLLLRGLRVKGIIDDNPSVRGIWEIPVVGNTTDYNSDFQPCIIAVGNNRIRQQIADKLTVRYDRAVHPSAIVARTARIGEGSVVMAGVVVNSDTSIGKHVIINTRASIDHDCMISDFVHIAPGTTLCGGITVGEGAIIGAGATILPNLKIGKWATIGAGATVTRDIPAGETVVGCPANPINQKQHS